MAAAEDEIDPSDLDSIDALLDQAALGDVPTDDAKDELPTEVEAPADLDGQDDVMSNDDIDLDDILDEVAMQAEPADPEPSEPELPEIEESMMDDLANEVEESAGPAQTSGAPDIGVEEMAVAATTAAAAAAVSEASKDKEPDKPDPRNDEDYVQSRLGGRGEQSTELDVEQLKSLKKLVIIFGSVTVFLLVTALGIGIWGGMAASHAGLSEETEQLIEKIHTQTEKGVQLTEEAERSVTDLEKKIDAINFQIEQMVAEMAQAPVATHAAPTVTHSAAPLVNLAHEADHADPHAATHNTHATQNHTNTHVAPVVHTPATLPVQYAPPALSDKDIGLMRKQLDSLSGKLIAVEKKVREVNRRVIGLQSGQDKFMSAAKAERKNLEQQREVELKKQKLEAEKAELEKQQQSSPYQYRGDPLDVPSYDSYP